MSELFTLLRSRIDHNARRAVEVYTTEVADFRALAAKDETRAAMLDFAVLLRRRQVELAEDDAPFTAEDLAVLTASGVERGRQGVSLSAQRRVMTLHSTLTLREILEVAGERETTRLTRVLGWIPPNARSAQHAYTKGFLLGQKHFLPLVGRIRQLAKALLTDDVAAADLAEALDLRVTDDMLVLSVRVARSPAGTTLSGDECDQLLHALVRRSRVPMTWTGPNQFIALLPGVSARSEQRALALARDLAELVELPCSLGAAGGRMGNVAEAAALAIRVSRASPPQAAPTHLPSVRDVFVELGVAALPQVGEWLTDLGHRLSTGPDLVRTLDAFYRHDMNRLHTAGELRIHPRTLDYRLHRVRELVGLDPGSTRGVRTLSTAVARLRAG
jgi:PucR C-terminal helix-turn-helix domain